MRQVKNSLDVIWERIESLLLAVAGLIGLTISFWPGAEGELPRVTLSVLSTLSLALGVERAVVMVKIRNSIRELGEATKNIDHKLQRIDDLLLDRFVPDAKASTDSYKIYLDPYLSKVFQELLADRTGRFNSAILRGELLLDSKEDFVHFYIGTLKYFSKGKAEFIATSLPSQGYFWTDATLAAVAEFVRSGSKMSRIFLIDHEDPQNDKVTRILESQKQSGISVFTTNRNSVSARLRETLILADRSKKIAWEVHTNGTGEPKEILITTNPSKVKALLGEIDAMHKEPY